MKQNPQKLKYKKYHKSQSSILKLNEQKVFIPHYGKYALKSLAFGSLTYKQIEACRKSMKRNVKKNGMLWLRVFTYKSVTQKGLGVRMGKGKGSHSFWKCPIKPGQIVCEIESSNDNIAIKALKSASSRLPFKSKIIKFCY